MMIISMQKAQLALYVGNELDSDFTLPMLRLLSSKAQGCNDF